MVLVRISFLLCLLSLGSLRHYEQKSFAFTKNDQPTTLTSPQQLANEGYFGRVLDISPATIVGNFCEPRKGHFHTGLDFRTNQQEGHAVYAAADGYVSRINVSGGGYGNALYITHPNGYVTVYGHLQQFSSKLTQRLRKEQYAKESFTVDFELPAGEFIISKGEKVALSGNSGGSGGPHLHFEIRDLQERVYNPMLFGYKLKDDLKPVCSSLKFYPLDDLKNKSEGYRVKLVLNKERVYELEGGILKVNAERLGFSVNTYDVMNLTDAHVGIYNLTVFDGSKMIYQYQADRISFPEKRYVLSHIDYPIFMNESRRAFHKCFVEPGNKGPLYPSVLNAGVIDLSDGRVHELNAEVSDYAGNVSLVKFKLQWDEASVLFKEKKEKYTKRFDYHKDNDFANSDIKAMIPKGHLFDDVFFNYSSSLSTEPTIFSRVHELDQSNTQVFDWFPISIKTEKLNPVLADKAVVVYKDANGSISSRGGKVESGFITTKAREFGTYYVKLDTTIPQIKVLNVTSGKNMRASKKIVAKITDNLSGIADFDTYIDDKWVLTNYDAKGATLTHLLDQKLSSGQHTFKIIVEDERKNRAEYSVKFAM
jgi:murein DD-endopeptidase MepM/ murein hydrolase activator NlpD